MRIKISRELMRVLGVCTLLCLIMSCVLVQGEVYAQPAWIIVTSPTTVNLNSVWGSSATDVWAVGDGGTIIHWGGSEWSTITSPTTVNIYSVWGSGPDDIYAVMMEAAGSVLHYDGYTWTETYAGGHGIRGVWGTSPTSFFIVGHIGYILKWDGIWWSEMHSQTIVELMDVWGTDPNDVFVIGEGGTLLHYDGNRAGYWMVLASPTVNNLYGVWGSSATDVWAVGNEGTILYYGILNIPPIASDKSVTTKQNTPVDITLSANDDNGDQLTYSIVSPPGHGTLSGTPPDVTYIPALNYYGSDSFTYQAFDGELYSNVATVSITVDFDLNATLNRLDTKLNGIISMVKTVDVEVIWQESAPKRENSQVFHIGATFGGQPISASLISTQGIRVTTTPPPTYEIITASAFTPGPGFLVVTVTSPDLIKYSFFQFQVVYNDGVVDRFGTVAVRNNAFVPLK